MDHTGVAAALVRADRALLLDDDDRSLRMRAADRAGRCQPHDPAAHHEHVDAFHCAANNS